MNDEKLDAMIDALKYINDLANSKDNGFIAVYPEIRGYIQINSDYFSRYFGDTGKVYDEDDKNTYKEAFYNGVRFIALFDKKGENNDCTA